MSFSKSCLLLCHVSWPTWQYDISLLGWSPLIRGDFVSQGLLLRPWAQCCLGQTGSFVWVVLHYTICLLVGSVSLDLSVSVLCSLVLPCDTVNCLSDSSGCKYTATCYGWVTGYCCTFCFIGSPVLQGSVHRGLTLSAEFIKVIWTLFCCRHRDACILSVIWFLPKSE